MQKKLIALSIASAMSVVPALAYAEVNVSGQANMSVDVVNNGAVTNSVSNNQLNSNQSRLVFKGSEDLGDGLSAIYQLDTRFNVDNGTAGSTSTFWGGNNYIGLKGNSWGAVMVGRIDAPYKTAFRKLDLFYDVAGDNRVGVGAGQGGLFTTDVRLNNVLAYMSPSMSGFQVALATVFGAETPVAPPNNAKGQAYSLSATYSMDSLYFAGGYQDAKQGDAGTGDLGGTKDNQATSWKLGGGWTKDAFTVNAEVEGTTAKTLGNADQTGTNFYLAGSFALSASDSIRLAYTNHGETEGGAPVSVKNDDSASQYAIGYAHDMSKATSVYATYVKTSSNPGYSSGVTNYSTAGADPSVISLGMKHAF